MGRNRQRPKRTEPVKQPATATADAPVPQPVPDMAANPKKSAFETFKSFIPVLALIVSSVALYFSCDADRIARDKYAVEHRPIINLHIEKKSGDKFLIAEQIPHGLGIQVAVLLENVGSVHATHVTVQPHFNSYILQASGTTQTVETVNKLVDITLGPGQKTSLGTYFKWLPTTDDLLAAELEDFKSSKSCMELDISFTYSSIINPASAYSSRLAARIFSDHTEILKSDAD